MSLLGGKEPHEETRQISKHYAQLNTQRKVATCATPITMPLS